MKSGANPEQIKISLSGVKDCGVQNAECGIENPKSEFQNPKLEINKSGELVAETELGPVKFTKPIAYQEINGKRVDVSVEYRIQKSKSAIQNLSPTSIGNPKSKIANRKLEYGFKVASTTNPTTSSSTPCWHPRIWAGSGRLVMGVVVILLSSTQAGMYM